MESTQSSLLLQKNIKDNTDDLHDFLADLKNWEREIKEVDNKLSNQGKTQHNTSSGKDTTAHPVRVRNHQSPTKSILKQTENNKQMVNNKNSKNKKAKRLPCDYAAWDKFDVEKALESSEEEEQELVEERKQSTPKITAPVRIPTPSNKKERANILKEEGNKLYSKGRLEDAVAKYTQGMALDPTNALLPANRAMAYIKLEKFTAAEADCNRCLKLDCDYIKGYLRRATARLNLGKEELARRDCLKVLEMEPGNKEAKRELEKLRDISNRREESRMSTVQMPENIRLVKEERSVPIPSEVGKEEEAVKEKDGKSEGTQMMAQKRKGSGKKVKIIEVNSGQDRIPAKANQIMPIEKPPHLRSKKPLRRIPVKDISSWEDMNKKPIVEMKVKVAGSSGVGCDQQDKAVKEAVPLKTPVLESSRTAVPSVPKTSHQFTQDWHRLSGQAGPACEYLKVVLDALVIHLSFVAGLWSRYSKHPTPTP